MGRRPVAVVGEEACMLVGSAAGIVPGARQHTGRCLSAAERRSRRAAADFAAGLAAEEHPAVAGCLGRILCWRTQGPGRRGRRCCGLYSCPGTPKWGGAVLFGNVVNLFKHGQRTFIPLIHNALGGFFGAFFCPTGCRLGALQMYSQVINNFCHTMCTNFLKKFIFFEKIAIFVDKSL